MMEHSPTFNWPWIRLRAQVWRCRHRWMAGLTNWPDQEKPPWKIQACEKCGVWRWFPFSAAYTIKRRGYAE